jgi:hypothetical protein
MDHLSNNARVALAESGLHMRAMEILGVHSIDETTAEKYAEALVKADAEGAGKAYVEKVAMHAGVLASAAADKSEGEHRAAVSYLRAGARQGRLQRCRLRRSRHLDSGDPVKAATKPPIGPLGPIPPIEPIRSPFTEETTCPN